MGTANCFVRFTDSTLYYILIITRDTSGNTTNHPDSFSTLFPVGPVQGSTNRGNMRGAYLFAGNNPFNSTTVIKFMVSEDGQVKFMIYNCLGAMVYSTTRYSREGRESEIRWNAAGMNSGIYLARLESNGFRAFCKLFLVK